mmetsp:Transcript_53513/g.98980  ORF Transcript_53513/g.98980 Transcript_53513/m.98980 type:complete len:147 (-) Transcript_53513:142-582(-)
MAAVETTDVELPRYEEEVNALRQQYEAQADTPNPSPSLQFQFGCLLICSSRRAEIAEGLELLTQLSEVGFQRTQVSQNLAMGHLKMGNYVAAKEHVDEWRMLEPADGMARMVESVILHRASQDGHIAVFLLGAVALACATWWKCRR